MEVLKPGLYYVYVLKQKFFDEDKRDISKCVKNFAPFGSLGIDMDGDVVRLVFENGKPIFVSFPMCFGYHVNGFKSVKAADVVDSQVSFIM